MKPRENRPSEEEIQNHISNMNSVIAKIYGEGVNIYSLQIKICQSLLAILAGEIKVLQEIQEEALASGNISNEEFVLMDTIISTIISNACAVLIAKTIPFTGIKREDIMYLIQSQISAIEDSRDIPKVNCVVKSQMIQ